MKSIKELYRIGTGPSSSHTMAPRRAAEQFLARHPEAAAFRVTLYGSLAATGRGHMTDRAIIDTLLPTAPVDIVWQAREFLPFHPNGMRFQALDTAGTPTDTWTVYSIGGSRFGNYEGLLPEANGRTWTECDINTLGADSRGAERIVFSNDGLIYYTGDHYKTFELLYGGE